MGTQKLSRRAICSRRDFLAPPCRLKHFLEADGVFIKSKGMPYQDDDGFTWVR